MGDLQRAFEAVAALPPRDREAWLQQNCAGNRPLREEVESLLCFHSIADDPLEQGCRVESGMMRAALIASKTEEMPLFEPPGVPGYENFTQIAVGGQGVVYRARQVSTGQRVAVKVLFGHAVSSASAKRFRRESALLAELQHPNIVTIIDQQRSSDGVLCLVTRFVQGLTLDEFRRQLNRDASNLFAKMFGRVCAAVEAAHRKGVIHRDLKPSNIIVDENHEPYLLDFGLAKLAEKETEPVAVGATIPGSFLGSIPWASPEQIDSSIGAIQPQTDVYQLAVIAYHYLSGGKFPYPVDGGYLTAFHRILRDAPAPLSGSTFSMKQLESINRVLLKALSKAPAERYASPIAFCEALTAAILQPRGELPTPATSHHITRPRRWWPVCAGSTLAIAAGLWVFWGPPPTTQPLDQLSPQLSPQHTGPNETAGDTLADTTVLEVDFASLQVLPANWQADPVAMVARRQLTIPPGTMREALVQTNRFRVEGDWQLNVDHEIRGNGQLRVTLLCDDQPTVDLRLHRGRIETLSGQREESKVIGRRTLSIQREGDRLTVQLQGAEPIFLDASACETFSQLKFGMQNAGSGGGEVGIHSIRLREVQQDPS